MIVNRGAMAISAVALWYLAAITVGQQPLLSGACYFGAAAYAWLALRKRAGDNGRARRLELEPGVDYIVTVGGDASLLDRDSVNHTCQPKGNP